MQKTKIAELVEMMEEVYGMRTRDLLMNIRGFRDITPKSAFIDEMQAKVRTILPVKLGTTLRINNSFFYRVRKNDENSFTKYSDFWYPPNDSAKLGRLNLSNEPMLYLCLDAITPFYEAKINIGDFFTLMFYSYRHYDSAFDITLMDGILPEHEAFLLKNGLSETAFNNYLIICDFIRTELIRDVGEGTEYLYNISNLIKNYFDPYTNAQAFLYTSINNYKRKNLAVKPNIAKAHLKCLGAQYGELVSYSATDESITFNLLKSCPNEIHSDSDVKFDSMRAETVTISMNSSSDIKHYRN